MVPGAGLTALGGPLLVLGSCLPWYTGMTGFTPPGPYAHYGVERAAGILTLILGVVAILIGLRHLASIRLPVDLPRSSIAIGVIAGILVTADYLSYAGILRAGIREFTVSVESGIWIVMVGAVLTIVGGVLTRLVSKS
jgi:hypothetical protein